MRMLQLDFSNIALKMRTENEKARVYDIIRKKWIILTPEEHVRQLMLHYLIHEKKYPSSFIAVEKKILLSGRSKRFDAVIYGKDHKPWMLMECKRPDEMITQEVLFQLLNYQRVVQSQYWLLTNGHQIFCADATDIEDVQWLSALPAYY